MLELTESIEYFHPITDISEFNDYQLSLPHEDKIRRLSSALGIHALFFDSGVLLIDNFSHSNNLEKVYELVTSLTNQDLFIRSVGVVPAEELRRLVDIKSSIVGNREEKIEEAQSIQQFSRLMARAVELKSQDVYITCSKSLDISYGQFKCDGILQKETFPLNNYLFGISVCRATYDGGQSAGSTIGSFDENSMQEKQIKHTVYSNSGVIQSKLQIRYIKTKTKRAGEVLVNMRIQQEAFRLHQLGLDDNLYRLLKEKITQSKGGIITSGRTGSGKSTTMFAALLERPRDQMSFTFEDPIEIEAPDDFINIKQNTMDKDTSVQMKAINRMNPDSVFVQELRDKESASFAFSMMLSGIPVLTTVHATSVVGVIRRFIKLGVHIDDITADKVLSLVMSQALTRVLCDHCKIPFSKMKSSDPIRYQATIEKSKSIKVIIKESMYFRNNSGCKKCTNSGTDGRKLVIEYVDISDKDVEFIRREAFSEWKTHLNNSGFNSIERQMEILAGEGNVCVQEMLEYF
jgi:type II secretory ATPase GspE/PulE/Tfp pilus assembly ATPase PilB-like protein